MTKPRPRYATLSGALADAIPAAGYHLATVTPERVKVTVKDGPNVDFVGVLVDVYDTNNGRERWEELLLYAVAGGGFVAVRHWHSSLPREDTFSAADAVVTVADAMAVWGWTTAAKGFGKHLGWDTVKRIGGAS